MRLTLSFLLTLLCSVAPAFSQNSDTIVDTKKKKKWTYGAVPAVAYDDDIGFKYGGLVNFYNYGDWKIYPEYYHSLYFEWSQTTKGSGIWEFTYDSKYLIPNTRFSFETSYLTERALDFYGFNGYESLFDVNFEDYNANHPDFKSRAFYKQERKLLRIRGEFQGNLSMNNMHWSAGLANYNFDMDTVDIQKLNKGINESETKYISIEDDNLYEQYIKSGIIPEDQVHGGNHTIVKTGLVYDTRDNEPKPAKGIWTELLLITSPSFAGNTKYSFGKLILTHRQYFELLKNKLDFAYRISYQDKLWGEMPYYFLPFVFNGGNAKTRDGLGGAKTLRGIRRDRLVGEDFIYGNMEFRWKFIETAFFDRNIYFALNAFYDYGIVTGKYKFETSSILPENQYLFPGEKEKLHQSVGGGLHFALNQNFVVAVNYGIALDKNDGNTGLYIGLNWLY